MKTMILDLSGNRPPSSIALRTRSNLEIENQQDWHSTRFDWSKLADPKRFDGATIVSDPCPVYNCHGLTFGSRRTGVHSKPHFILAEDGFKPIPEYEARVGDVVVYFDSQGSESHSGIVVGESNLIIGGASTTKGSKLPLIWSKWGKGCEVVHLVGNCPYDGRTARYYRLSWSENDGR
jgi:hypothetical protein